MNYELEGTLVKVYDAESKSASFQAREFVVEIKDGNYPQYVKFQCVQDRVNIVDSFREGDTVKVSFDLRGREWNGKYFTNLNAWRVVSALAQQEAPSMPVAEMGTDSGFPSTPPPSIDLGTGAFPSDDLPF